MFVFSRPPGPYQIIPPEDSDESDGSQTERTGSWRRRSLLRSGAGRWAKTSRPRTSIIISVISIFSIILVSTGLFQLGRWLGYRQGIEAQMVCAHKHSHPKTGPPNHHWKAQNSSGKRCENPSLRREWRSLSKEDKGSYLDAVRCLAETPSVLRNFGTVYDDFPWVHYQMANTTHGGASFLPWHRRFIHVYEQHLKELCGYRGTLPYWDWTLDWEAFAESPLFSPTLGFGGDGDPSAPESVGGGRCVTSGPLARLRPLFYGSRSEEHCLSRGFKLGGKLLESIKPEAVEIALRKTNYKDFLLAIENGPHNAIPNAVRGDFYSFTAPYDPLSYLHHAQLDRLWFQWQKRDLATRFSEYIKVGKNEKTVSLKDSIWMGGLDYHGDVTVEHVMDPENSDLCYRYA